MTPQQRKVSTFTSSVARKQSAILRCLGTMPEGATPKAVAFQTGLNVNTVKSILPNLSGVTKVMRGLYKVVNRGDGGGLAPGELSDWNFHNLVLTCGLGDVEGHLVNEVYEFGVVRVAFTIAGNARATFRVACDYPLNVSSIGVVSGLFRQLIAWHSTAKVGDSDIMISTVEFNKDYSNLRLDGVRCITVDSLCEQFKAYQKTRGLRIEHKTKVPMSVESVVDMLANNPNSVDLHKKLADQRALLGRLTETTTRNTELLFKLIDAGGLK